MWATIGALGCALAVGAAYLRLFTALFMTSLWAPAMIALGADACLVLLAIRNRNPIPR